MDVQRKAELERAKDAKVCMEPKFVASLTASRARKERLILPKLPKLRRRLPTVKEQLARIKEIRAELDLGQTDSASSGLANARSCPQLGAPTPAMLIEETLRFPLPHPSALPALRDRLAASVLSSFKTSTDRLDSDLLRLIRQVRSLQPHLPLSLFLRLTTAFFLKKKS